VLRDNKTLIYCGGALAGVAVTLSTIPSGAAFCVDNRAMCAPLATPPDDEPSGNEPHALLVKNSLSVIASTGSTNVPLYT
jgi:hypothetical protein